MQYTKYLTSVEMRYKEYNVNRVLEKCLQLFWAKGFRGCSINDIVEETGVNRFSLYHEFQDKEGLLYDSLRIYRERYAEPKFEILKGAGSPKEILQAFFRSFLKPEEEQQGCYIIHIGTELADTDLKIKEFINAYLSEIEGLIHEMLKRHMELEEDAAFYARHLIGLFCTSMSFCLILSEQQKEYHIANGLNLILNKRTNHATNAK
jgi:TetR/AcrR family transcriptional repressor of nem operon